MSAARSPLLVVSGADQEALNERGRRQISGSTDLWRLLGSRARFDELHLDPSFLKQPGRPDFRPYRCVLNTITDPDQNKQVLVILRKLLRDFPGRVLNPPDAVLGSTRDKIAHALAGIPALRTPRTIRLRGGKPKVVATAIENAAISFPLIVRLAGTHMGEIVGLVRTIDELQAALQADEPYILTEFVDFRGSDGLYRKYRVYFFGERRIFRHLIVADQWNIHVRDRYRFMAAKPALMDEEIGLLETPGGAFPPAVHDVLQAVRERMALDFFGIDFGIGADGQVVLFEANATMSFFPLYIDPLFSYLDAIVPPAQAAFRDMVRSGLRTSALSAPCAPAAS